jgi:hypothetical protein
MAAGDSLICWVPQHGEPPLTAYGTPDIRDPDQGTSHPVCDLALNERIDFSDVMPHSYGGTGLTVYIHYAMSSTASNDIKLETDFERIGDQQQDLDNEGFTASPQNTGDITVPDSSGKVDIVTTVHTDGGQIDDIEVGEGFRIRIKRIAVTGDDAAGDLEIRFVELRETPDP